jgi:hypothetical protein
MLSRPRFPFALLGVCLVASGLAAVPTAGEAAEAPATQPPEKPRPAGVIRLTHELFKVLVTEDVYYTLSEDRTAEGLRINADAVATGKADMKLDTSGEHPVFTVRLFGEASTRLRLDSGPVVAYAQSTTPFTSSQRITYDGERFFEGEPQVEAAGRTRVERIASRRRGPLGLLVRRVARRKLRREQPRINREVDAFTRDFVAGKLQEVKESFFSDLTRVNVLEKAVRAAFPESESWVYRLASDERHVVVTLGPEDAAEPDLAALGQPSEFPLLIWLRMTPEQALLAQMLLVSDSTDQIIRQLAPEKIADVLEGNVHIRTFDGWMELKASQPTVRGVFKAIPKKKRG